MKETSNSFEKMLRKHDLKPLERQHIGDGLYLYMAEGTKRPNEEMDQPHWLVIWAAGFDDKLQFGQYVRFPTHVRMPDSLVIVPSSQTDRISAVKAEARKVIDFATNKGMFNEIRH